MMINEEQHQGLRIQYAQEYMNNINILKNHYPADRDKHDEVNSYGYRGKDFDNNDVLVMGCSQTFGYDLPEKYSWPRILCDEIKSDFSNIAIPGSSLQSQVIKAFKYFEYFGYPKVIFAAFPFSRIESPSVSDQLYFRGLQSGSTIKEKNFSVNNIDLCLQLKRVKAISEFSKIPHDFQSLIPIEFAVYYNDVFMTIFEQFCKSHNIKLYWTFWQSTYSDFEDLVKEKFQNFFPFPEGILAHNSSILKMGTYKFQNDIFYDKMISLKDNELFLSAKDKLHWGIYQNMCLADKFFDIYSNE